MSNNSIYIESHTFPEFLIPTSSIKDWKDLQVKTMQLFQELGFEADEEVEVTLVRSKKVIDVLAKDQNSSFNSKIAIECKHWETNVPQGAVMEFQTVIKDGGFDIGIIISKNGFQKGAIEASEMSNVRLYTFEEFQNVIGNEWFNHQNHLLLEKSRAKFNQVGHAHFSQLRPENQIINNAGFDWLKLQVLAHWHMNITLSIGAIWPNSFQDKPIIPLEIYEKNLLADFEADNTIIRDGNIQKGFTTIRGTREYFDLANRAIDHFSSVFETEFHKIDCENLDHEKIFAALREESPLYVLKNKISNEQYEELLKLLEH